MVSTRTSIPRLPRGFYRLSLVGTATFITYSVALFVISGFLAGVVWAQPWSLPARAFAILPLAAAGGQGLHLLGFVGHEGFHGLLHRDKQASALLGIAFSSMVPGFLEVGVAASHAGHHRSTNTPEDPDCRLFGRHRGFWSRLLFTRLTANRFFIHNCLRLAAGRPPLESHRLPFPLGRMKRLARLNIAFSAGWLGVYAWLLWFAPTTATLAIALPFVAGALDSGLRPYLEHAATEAGAWRDSRTRSSFIQSILLFFNNYHLEHHLYPGVPCYRLGAVHRYLRAHHADLLARAQVDRSHFGFYQHAVASPYPDGSGSGGSPGLASTHGDQPVSPEATR